MKTEFLVLVPMAGPSQSHREGRTWLGSEWFQVALGCCFTLMLSALTSLQSAVLLRWAEERFYCDMS